MQIDEQQTTRKAQKFGCGGKKRFFLRSFTLGFFLLFSLYGNAQCAMCRASLESEGDMAKGEAVNNGIVYLMAIPYLLVALVGYYVYRTRFAKKG